MGSSLPPFGALPPSNRVWQVGLSVAAINFVQEAEARIATVEPHQREALQQKIDTIKSHRDEMDDDLTVDDFLASLSK